LCAPSATCNAIFKAYLSLNLNPNPNPNLNPNPNPNLNLNPNLNPNLNKSRTDESSSHPRPFCCEPLNPPSLPPLL